MCVSLQTSAGVWWANRHFRIRLMHSPNSARFEDHFANLTEPRRRKVVYPLINIVAVAICAVIAGADVFVSIVDWGRQNSRRERSAFEDKP
jgi:hypothetical protein